MGDLQLPLLLAPYHLEVLTTYNPLCIAVLHGI